VKPIGRRFMPSFDGAVIPRLMRRIMCKGFTYHLAEGTLTRADQEKGKLRTYLPRRENLGDAIIDHFNLVRRLLPAQSSSAAPAHRTLIRDRTYTR
jgi:hypothetical protein